jgi:hypothetical protein
MSAQFESVHSIQSIHPMPFLASNAFLPMVHAIPWYSSYGALADGTFYASGI